MIIREIKYSFFSLPLKSKFQNSLQSFNKREGFLIAATDELNNKTFGEASPFPNLSSESLINVENELKILSSQQFTFDENISSAIQKIKSLSLSCSTQFALEQIVLNLFLLRNRISILEYFNRPFKNIINVNAVLDINATKKIIENIQSKLEANYNTFKIKVGRKNFDEDIELLKEIRNQFGSSIKIRLDANGKWTFNDAIRYLKQLNDFNIEYIEDPCKDLENNLELSKQSEIPIALDIRRDESSKNNINGLKKIIEESKIKFIVIKPMICCGIFDTLQLIQIAEANNKFIILSSAFESEIGKSGLVFLAASVYHDYAHGLDTSDFFLSADRQDLSAVRHDLSTVRYDENYMTKDFYKVINGKINFDIANYPPQFKIGLPTGKIVL